MKKPVIFITILVALGIFYSIFLYKQSKYIAGENRYFTVYEKYMAKEKNMAITPVAYEEDKYNLIRLKDRAKSDINKLEDFRIELNSIYNSIYKPHNTVSDYENYTNTLKKLRDDIQDNQRYYQWLQNDLTDLYIFISEIEQDLFSIKLYEEDIYRVSSVVHSIDSIASQYLNTAEQLELVSVYRGYDLEKQIKAEKERKRQELIAQLKLEIELEKLRKERQSNSYTSYSIHSSTSSYFDDDIYHNYTRPSIPTYSTYDIPSYPSQFYSTNTNPNHVKVDGYYKSNGTYVEPYMRTAPNSTIIDNFSTSPNLNPYTGKIGTIKYKY
ncbi:hypothetical protein [Flagellimonas lutimaris]|uniref:hypothetical protein n=1 Tax=Flagellimonas lutimaris TaxID=475082 RepID=UPI0039C0C989